MASIINAATSGGLISTGDTSGQLQLQTAGTTALSISSGQVVTLTNALPVASGGTGSTTLAGANIATTNSSTQSITSINTFGFKNRIINGGMVIDQRNAGAAISSLGQYTTYLVDRFKYYGDQSGKLSFQQNQGSVTPPTGYVNYLGMTSLSAYSVGSGESFSVSQSIEGFNTADLLWGTANAKTVTLSFWVYSSLTGSFGASLNNGSRFYPFNYTISSASTWTQISITIAGDTSGTWSTTNSQSIRVYFGLGVGTTQSGGGNAWTSSSYSVPSSSVSVVGTSGATFYITGVQLEVGTQATSFDFRDYGRELILCQRYFFKIQAFSGAGGCQFTTMALYSATSSYGNFYLPVPMRTYPTGSYSALSDFTFFSNGSSSTITTLNISNGQSSSTTGEIYTALTTSFLNVGGAGFLRIANSTGYAQFSAEL